MNITKATLIALTLSACGAPIEGEGETLGTLEQAVYMPYQYGIEGLDDSEDHPDFGLRCGGATVDDYADNFCAVPDTKQLSVKFYASTCSSLWQAAVMDAWATWALELNMAGWSVSTPANNPKYRVECGTLGGDGLGRFQAGPSWDNIGVWYGTLGQHKTGKVTMDSVDADAWAMALAPNSASARHNIRVNLVLHELFHLAGLGHSTSGTGSALMSAQPNGTWVSLKNPTAAESDMLDCYNPTNGGLFDDC